MNNTVNWENSNIWHAWVKHAITMALEIKGVKDSFGFKRLLGVIHRFLECYDTSVEAV